MADSARPASISPAAVAAAYNRGRTAAARVRHGVRPPSSPSARNALAAARTAGNAAGSH
ncbi:hypothetical protein [Streptomyces odonnellii]|uniref:hypothetical protein n=1 Tax=Streptomyces odonnellii TaxID=1417980 RepID=UPI0012FF50FA|nr:hypothetical protein [Streptomyces odonnellii]